MSLVDVVNVTYHINRVDKPIAIPVAVDVCRAIPRTLRPGHPGVERLVHEVDDPHNIDRVEGKIAVQVAVVCAIAQAR